MVLGLIQFRFSARHLGEAGRHPGNRDGAKPKDWLLLSSFVGGIVLVVALTLAGVIHINPVKLARGTTYFIVGVAVLYFIARKARRVGEPVVDDLEEQELLELSRAELEDALSAGEFKALAWAAIVALGLRRIGTLAVDVDRMPLRADG